MRKTKTRDYQNGDLVTLDNRWGYYTGRVVRITKAKAYYPYLHSKGVFIDTGEKFPVAIRKRGFIITTLACI